MRTIPPAELKKILKSAALEKAVQLCRDKRVYNLKSKNGAYSAFVLAEKPMPFSPSFAESDEQVSWSCDCVAEAPCLHFWALTARMYLDGTLYHAGIRASYGAVLNPSRARRDARAKGIGATLDLFDESMYQPSLFDDDDPRSASPLLTEAIMPAEAVDRTPRFPRPEHHRPTQGAILVRFQALNHPELVVESLDLRLPDKGDQGLLETVDQGLEALSCLAALLRNQSDRTIRFEDALPHLVVLQQSLLEREDRERSICFVSPGRRLKLFPWTSLSIEPVFAQKGSDGRGQYHLRMDVHSAENQRHPSVPMGAIACAGSVAYLSLRDADTVLYHQDDADLVGLLHKLRGLRDLVRAFDIEMLRAFVAEKGIQNVSIAHLADENFEYRSVKPRALVSLQGSLGRTELFLRFSYAGQECGLLEDRRSVTEALDSRTTIVYPRSQDLENAWLLALKSLLGDMTQYERGLYADMVNDREVADISVVCELSDFVTRQGQALMDAGFGLRMEGRPIRPSSGSISFRAESGLDWFGFRAGWKPDVVEPGAFLAVEDTGDDLDASLSSMPSLNLHIDEHLDRLGMTEVSQPDGGTAWIILGSRDIDRLKLLRKLGMNADGMLETSPVNVTLIDSLYSETENKDEHHIVRARELSKNLADFTGPQIAQPSGLQTTLRPYQLIGYNWLVYLHQQKLGGCLADDMGLGKTVQTIALLQYLKEKNKLGAVLLIAPVVTLPNWEDELARFAPTLHFHRHSGNDRARTVEDLVPPANGPELVLVSYHTLRNDLDLFVQVNWDYIILDEAHYIKNAGSQIFKAIRVLPAAHRLSLTGTPIENSTMELWSQFSFLNPGLLGGKRRFMSDVAAPIEKSGDEAALGTLRDTIGPFILRRKKQDVLDDLPPKDEILHWCEMAPDQARLYDEHRQLYRDQIAGILNEKGLERSNMDVFRFLLRLRQLAIHPAMIQPTDPKSEGASPPYAHISSCKMESLRMILDESLQEDHKMLVFSQFVRALKLISTDLDQNGIRHALLTGATIDRRTVVKDFQEDPDLRLFLLSLKAGGVGINLTSADYVVLFDPWWNPAAERQAVDRAHRIGQKRPVIVYKFITRNTIEEKILALQYKKQGLVSSLLGGGDEALMTGMSEDDVMGLFE